jgi:integrase
MPILLSTTTGARRSEVLGIAWSYVDLDSGLVRITRNLQRLPAGQSFAFLEPTSALAVAIRSMIESPARSSPHRPDVTPRERSSDRLGRERRRPGTRQGGNEASTEAQGAYAPSSRQSP